MRDIFCRGVVIFSLLVFAAIAQAQQADSVDVTFFYAPAKTVANVYLPGEFNSWLAATPSRMLYDVNGKFWHRTVRLRVGGPNPLPGPKSVPGAYQYKINENGSTWLSDPLNPRQNISDENNSILYTRNPTIHYLLPNITQAAIRSKTPPITVYIFPKIGDALDLTSLQVQIDSVIYSNLGQFYNAATRQLTFVPATPLENGPHKLRLTARTASGSTAADSTTFSTLAGQVQLLSLPAETWKSTWMIYGAFYDSLGNPDLTLTTATLTVNGVDFPVSVANGKASMLVSLQPGDNQITLTAKGETTAALTIKRLVEQKPTARIEARFSSGNASFTLSAATSSDPQGQALAYEWHADPYNPDARSFEGTAVEKTESTPLTPGNYAYNLIVTNSNGYQDRTRFAFSTTGNYQIEALDQLPENPAWVKNGRIYTLFFKAFTTEGTIRAAIPRLQYIKDMGFNIVWTLPVMDTEGTIDNQINIGYNIMDLMKIAPEYGTAEDFKAFTAEAHRLGLKVILDVTPNHTGRLHPFAQSSKEFAAYSPYWGHYQTEAFPGGHNDNSLGQCVTPQGLRYYCGFSEALLNWDWADTDGQRYMTDVYKYWLQEFDLDGFRFDVYWGPHRRYGNALFGAHLRRELKHVKPDIFLLGEDDGTGSGTETLYGDRSGGLDSAYDFKLYFNAMRDFNFTATAVNTLHNELNNSGFHPGINSYFMRFMESQDEDRIAYKHNSFEKTMPLATALFTAPGIPMLYNGQEVGFGRGMGAPGEPDLNTRRRGVINWSFAGRSLLTPHYHKLAQIRAQFPAFAQHKRDTNNDGSVSAADESDFERVTTSNSLVYAFVRPYPDDNGVAVMNFSTTAQTVTLTVPTERLKFSGGFSSGATYYVNNLYANTVTTMTGGALTTMSVTLPAYGSAVYVISTQERHARFVDTVLAIEEDEAQAPAALFLQQSYPNPFTMGLTTIRYALPAASPVKLTVYNVAGQRIKTLQDETMLAGEHETRWDGRDAAGQAVGSGVYFYQLETRHGREQKRLVVIR